MKHGLFGRNKDIILKCRYSIPFTVKKLSNISCLTGDTGEIIINKPLDYETVVSYNLTVVVTDEEGMSSTTYVVIPIQDANDKNPYFMQNLYSFSLPENEPAGNYYFF